MGFLAKKKINSLKKTGKQFKGETEEGEQITILFNRKYAGYMYFPDWQRYNSPKIYCSQIGEFIHIENGLYERIKIKRRDITTLRRVDRGTHDEWEVSE
jgi:hypothetical protein